MNLITIGDYYRARYGRTVEVLTSLAIILSYLGWVAAQILALGLVFSFVTQGAISHNEGMVIGAGIVLVYTLFGGMWSVAMTDAFQMTIIVVAMLYLAWFLSGMAGGAEVVINHAAEAGKFRFLPEINAREIFAFIGAAVTMMLGSIPQQDVFQRVMSAKNEKTAVRGSILGGSLYFMFAFIPLFLAYCATLIDPAMVNELIEKDTQLILPTLIMKHTPVFAQVMFFGALLSAIMSTASGTLLAPSVTFSENILKGLIGHQSDRHFLWTMRIVVVCFAVVVTLFALTSTASIYEMVGNAYKVTLVAAFIPLVCGLYWKRANTQGAMFAIIAGVSSWLLLEIFHADGLWPPQLAGLLMSALGMLTGSLLPDLTRQRRHHASPHQQKL
jgi:Na+/proline symporter